MSVGVPWVWKGLGEYRVGYGLGVSLLLLLNSGVANGGKGGRCYLNILSGPSGSRGWPNQRGGAPKRISGIGGPIKEPASQTLSYATDPNPVTTLQTP